MPLKPYALLAGLAFATLPSPVMAGPGSPANVAAPSKNVLVLHRAAEPGSFRGKFDVAFNDTLRAAGPMPIDVYEEVIDDERFPGPEQSAHVRDYLKSKYADRTIDVLVAQGTVPFDFARQNRTLFGNPPIVSLTLAVPQGLAGNSRENITWIQTQSWIGGTIDLAQALLPEARFMVVVDGSKQGAPIQDTIEKQAKERDPGLKVVYLRDLPLDRILARLSSLPGESFLVFVRQILNPRGDGDQLETLSTIAAASPVPVFGHLEEFLGHGVVGGHMWQFENDAKQLADMTARVIGGTRAADIPRGRGSFAAMVDWRELKRWNIPESRVPPGAIVLFRPSALLTQNRGYVAAAALIFFAQFGLIVALLVSRHERKRAEEESRRGKDRYRSVVDTQSELVCRFRPDTTLTFVNDAYCRFCNTTRDKLLGTKFIDIVPAAARRDVLDRIHRLAFGMDSMEHPVTLPDGNVGWHHWVNHAILDSRGQVVEVQGVGRDITEQKRAQDALTLVEARNRAMLRAIPDLMFVLTRDGTYVDYHARDEGLLYVPPSVFLGRKIRDIMPPALAEVFMEAIEQTWQADEPIVVEYDLPMEEIHSFEARLVRADGDRILSMVRDVTESKRAVALNRDLAGRLIASQEVERQRIARELHDDVSQRLALLNIGIDELARKVEGDPRSRLQQLSLRTHDIASALRNLSHDLHPSRLQALGLVSAIEILCREMSQQIGVTVPFIHGVLPRDIDPNVGLCLYRIAQEALNNVGKHSRARHAQVQLAHESGMLVLQIADSGVGFDPRDTRHSGLGLISMRERVAFLKGQIVIHGVPAGGTRIGVRIPVGQPAESAAPISQSA